MSTKFFKTASTTVQNQLVSWFNDAALVDGHKKADLLRKITEVLLHQSSQSIPMYIDNILSWGNDKSVEVKKQVVVFIEELSKSHPEYIPKVVGLLRMLLMDPVIAVQKRVIQAASILYRHTLLWICESTSPPSEMQVVWDQLSDLKLRVLNMVDNDNEGIRTHSVKFLEEVVLLQSTNGSEDDSEFTLDNLPTNVPFIKRKALEEETEHIFTLLLKFHNSQHISSVNLMACMTTLCSLAKFRPKFMSRVIRALGDLHTTLPPTLSQSQVNSVRKHLRAQLINLLKHPSSSELSPQVTQLLLDTGMTPQELSKVMPKDRRNKRMGDIRNGEGQMKRPRIDSPQSNSQGSDNSNSRSDFNLFDDFNETTKISTFEEKISTADEKIDLTEEVIFDALNSIDTVVAIVKSTLLNNLPDIMPIDFITNYQPIPNAGSVAQKRSLAKMLINQIKGETPAPILPPTSLSNIAAKIPLLRDDDEKITLKNAVAKLQETSKVERQMESAMLKLMEETRQESLKEQIKEQEKQIPPPTPSVPKLKQRVKLLKLQELTQPIPKEIKEKLMVQAVGRILSAEKESDIGGVAQIRAKLITTFASSYTPELRELVLGYILDNPADRMDLAIAWLYEEFALMQGFNRHPVTLQPKVHEKHDQNYNELLCKLITQICERGDAIMENSKDVLMRRIYLEAPLITDEAVDYLKHLVTEEKMTFLALELLEEICLMRPPKARKYVTALLSHTISESEEIRDLTLKSVLKIYSRSSDAVMKVIEKYAKLYLGFIALNNPPADLFNPNTNRMSINTMWTDDLYKLCLNLIMVLFSQNEDLILEVARIYGQANADAKRCVLRCIETPIRQVAMGPPRPAFLQLLEECPRGAETLLTRLVHILTEKSPPTEELVSRVRELYATRVSDVRFLIPVLNGLTKKEILAALPKLIKLNPVVVKEVFNRLLGLQSNSTTDELLPVSPSELFVALHLIDPNKADLKYIIKATALCFAEKQTYTQEVVSDVLQTLVEVDEIPVLLMRSMLQALSVHPPLAGLVLNLLQRLIEKEVWSHKVAWEGWIKCCERTLPASTGILVRLPGAPLAACLSSAPALSAALGAHVTGLSAAQRALLPAHVLAQLTPPVAQHALAPKAVVAPEDYQMQEPQFKKIVPPYEPLPPGMD